MSAEPIACREREAPLRPPGEVMRLERMGSGFPTRLSFMRTLVRRMHDDGWRIERPLWALDGDGYGRAVYRVVTPERTYSLVVFSRALDPAKRTDRVIAEAWDATFALFDGEPGEEDIDRLEAHVPRQEAGHCSERELVLARANKSVRLFAHVVDRLAAGEQPDIEFLSSIGYLMRTTAVYGNGKFGIADRHVYDQREELAPPFQAELLTVYVIRSFTHDLVEHIARARSPDTFVPLDDALKRHLGIGNATGLGMAPFMHAHPALINNWVWARETALARVRSVARTTPDIETRFRSILARTRQHIATWNVGDERQMSRIVVLRDEFETIASWLNERTLTEMSFPWDAVCERVSSRCGLEAQELMLALLLEPHGALIDDLAGTMRSQDPERLDPAMDVAGIKALIDQHYAWVFDVDLTVPNAEAVFWYVSEQKLEPRIGLRDAEPGADHEMPLHVVRDVQALALDLSTANRKSVLAAFLLTHPEHRHIVRRVQTVARYPYGEVRDNLVGPEMLAIDLLRFKLAFFGATRFDPKSDKWTRITLFQGAPLPGELECVNADDWAFPVGPDAAASAVA